MEINNGGGGSGTALTVSQGATAITNVSTIDFDGSVVVASGGAGIADVTISGSTITGSDTQVLFFDGANNPAGDAGFTYNKTTDTLNLIGGATIGDSTTTATATTTIKKTIGGASTTDNFLNITGTVPGTLSAVTNGVLIDITGVNSTSIQNALYINGPANASGSSSARGLYVSMKSGSGNSSTGIFSQGGAGAPLSYGIVAVGGASGNQQTGVMGYATASNGGTQTFGVVGYAANATNNIGGWFGLTTPAYLPALSAALVADNGAAAQPIFLARDNGTTVFTVADGGKATGFVFESSRAESDTPFSGNNTYPGAFIGKDGYWALRSDTAHGFHIDTYNSGSQISPFSLTQAGGTTIGSSALASTTKALVVNNGTSTGNIFEAQDNGTAVFTVANGGNMTYTAVLIGSTQALTGAGAANVTTETTKITSTGVLDAISLADGVDGQTKTILHDVDGGSFVLTPTTKTGFTTFTSTEAGESITLRFVTTRGWIVIGSFGGVIA